MATILPFIGIFYNPSKIKDLKYVISPPYDVIEDEQFYYNLSKYNIVRVEKNENYTEAANYFNQWLNNKILISAEEEAIYLLEQKYDNKKRYGIIVLLQVEELHKGVIYPHEKIFNLYKEDRLRVLKECCCNTSPIFLLYSDKKEKILNLLKYKLRTKPLLQVTDFDNVEHKVWQITDREKINRIIEFFKNKELIIADGHHRYNAALQFAKETGYNFLMCYLTNVEDKNLTILPTHRVVRVNNFATKEFIPKLEQYFDIKKVSINELLNRKKLTLGMYMKDGSYLISLKRYIHTLDVIVLHNIILKEIIKVDDKDNIHYTRDATEAIDLVNTNKYQITFLTNKPDFNIIKKMVKNKEVVPPKTTYFYPKLPSGLIMSKFTLQSL